MPDIFVGNQLFDLAFHPTGDLVYAATVAGEVKCYSYDEQGCGLEKFSIRLGKRSCRGLSFAGDGQTIYAVGKDGSLHLLDPETGKVKAERSQAHEAAINRVYSLNMQTVATGDDEGLIKLWDPRQTELIRALSHHSDFISDFNYAAGKHHLISTSGDETISVVDIRSNKAEPIAHSESQEDELLSVVPIKDRSRYVVGTQLGVLAVFDPEKGWADCVDRIPGHPASVEALVAFPESHNVILTGSSDGMIRAVQVYPNKLLGVIGDHGDFPIERMQVCRQGRWLGSASHDEILKLTDIKDCLEDSDGEKDQEVDAKEPGRIKAGDSDEESRDSSDEEIEERKKRKKKRERDPLGIKKKKADLQDSGNAFFFADL